LKNLPYLCGKIIVWIYTKELEIEPALKSFNDHGGVVKRMVAHLNELFDEKQPI
jgi:hypothetical protein